MTTAQVSRTRNNAFAAGSLLALAAVALALLALPLGAEENEENDTPDPIVGDELTSVLVDGQPVPMRGAFTDDVRVQVRDRPGGRPTEVVNLRDASHHAVMRITIQPGAMFPWHTHPGPVLVTIVEGDPEGAFKYIYADDCVERPYGVGEAFVDPGGDNVHTAYNPSAAYETVVYATFLGVPSEGPLTVPLDSEEAAALDDKCGIERNNPGHNH